MAKSKDDVKYGTAQARLSEDEMLRVAYKHGTPLEAGKIADSEPVDLYSAAHNISRAKEEEEESGKRSGGGQTQEHRDTTATSGSGGRDSPSTK